MGLRLSNQDSTSCFFVTTTLKNWKRLGEIGGFYQALTDSISYCCNKFDAQLLGYVFMPHHIHLVILIDGARLGSFMRDFKKYTAQKVAPSLGIDRGGICMSRYDRVAIFSEATLRTKLSYIHQNPVKSGLVSIAENWAWSSAQDYAGSPGPLVVFTGWA